MALWLAAAPLVLASRSPARRALLAGAGLPCEVEPADIDERGIERTASGLPPDRLALTLAEAKARTVSRARPGRLVLGADQTLAFAGRAFSKPADRTAAREQLRLLRGKTHALHSALVLQQAEKTVFRHVETARLTMRRFSDDFLERYLDAAGAAAVASVGGYQLEGLGAHLFETVEGDYFTILGLPLMPLLAFLRSAGHVAA